MNKGNILIIDDEEKLRGLLARIIGLEGYHIFDVPNAKAGFRILEQENIDLVITDVKLPDANGVELTTKIKSLYPYVEIIVLTAYGTIEDGVKAIKNGAFDYITKGDDNDKIVPLVSKGMEKALLQKKVWSFENKLSAKYDFGNILGKSSLVIQAIELIKKVAVTDTTVLLTGETGTGKEIFAQTIHYNSQRKDKSFVPVNCGALGKDILESELFGYKAGAFTGASKDKRGLFEEANGGTIFLDEIGEMNMDLQSKLLRVLETGQFIKVGDTKETKVNVRVIAATNRDLKRESEEGKFRSDLFYRLSVFQVQLPSLRDRKQDILLLADYFIQQFSSKTNKRIHAMSPEFSEALMKHVWKGNIRELKNVIERSVILTDNSILSIDTLPYDFNLENSEVAGDHSFSMAEMEKNHIRKVLAYTKGNKTQTAKLLDIGLTTLYQKIKDYGL